MLGDIAADADASACVDEDTGVWGGDSATTADKAAVWFALCRLQRRSVVLSLVSAACSAQRLHKFLGEEGKSALLTRKHKYILRAKKQENIPSSCSSDFIINLIQVIQASLKARSLETSAPSLPICGCC